MIEGGWSFVWGAYAVCGVALTALAVSVVWRLAKWSRAARELENK